MDKKQQIAEKKMKNQKNRTEPSRKEAMLTKLMEAYEKLPRDKKEALLALVEGCAEQKGGSL